MIKTRYNRLADKIFEPYLNRLFRKHFHRLHIVGDIPQTDPDLPVLLLPNHSTWWDGFFVYRLGKTVLSRPVYLMMLEEQLERFYFFRWLGAYGIQPGNSGGIRDSLRYTQELLASRRAGRPPLCCIFAQGELAPWYQRPLNFQRGVQWLIRNYDKPLNLLPLAIRTEFLNEQRPEVFFLFGENRIVGPGEGLETMLMEQVETSLLDDLESRIANGKARQSKEINPGPLSEASGIFTADIHQNGRSL